MKEVNLMKLYEFKVKDVTGKEVSLSKYQGKVLLIVNTATHCGYTPQYDGLEKLYDTYKEKGLEVLDFPCNQFLNQAPESSEEIASICKLRFNTQFQTFAKIEVNGNNAHPLYSFLKEQAPIDNKTKKGKIRPCIFKKCRERFSNPKIKWNFTKFLIDRNGNVIDRFAPSVKPDELASHIEKLL